MQPFEIGVCTWSLDRHDIVRGIELAGGELGLRVVQIGFFTQEAVRCADSCAIRQACARADVGLVGAFVGFEGEDYSSIDRIAVTGGYTPSETYPSRFAATLEVARLTVELGCRSVAVHVGTIPQDSNSPVYGTLVERVSEVADALADMDVRLLIETGRESADTLLGFLAVIGRPTIGVNFDPGNLVVYGSDDPAQAVVKLGKRIENVHLKDALQSARPGVEYGRPASLGTGDAAIPRVISKLRVTGYAGPLLVETSSRDAGVETVQRAVDYLHSMVARP